MKILHIVEMNKNDSIISINKYVREQKNVNL